MEELIVYKKNVDKQLDLDFSNKKKYGDVYYYKDYIYVKKGFKWFYTPLNRIESVKKVYGTRQLRQCCGAPIYQTKMLLLTTLQKERIYLNIEETENGDAKRLEALVDAIKAHYENIEFL